MDTMRREGDVVNAPLTTNEAVSAAFRKIRLFMDIGVCEPCALKLTAREYNIDPDRLTTLWRERED